MAANSFDALMQDLRDVVSAPLPDDVAEKVRETVVAQIRDSFDRRQSPDGVTWEPLKGPSKATGKLRDAAVDAAYNGTVTEAGYKSEPMEIGRAQNDGDPDRHIPARPFWGISQETAAKVLDIVVDAKAKAVRK